MRANASVLRPGGLLFLTVPNRYAIWYRIGMGTRSLLGYLPDGFDEEPFSRKELIELAGVSGLGVLEVECAGRFVGDFKYWIGRNLASAGRKLTRGKPPPPVASERKIEEIDPRIEVPLDSRSFIDRHFTHALIFAATRSG